jgi:rfaE bifunctional protein kinase chain/domain
MNTAKILADIRGVSVLVVGDICLDRWCQYDPDLAEPSRETGLPRIATVRVDRTPGAGGTVANNLAALGVGRVAVLGAIGEDSSAHELVDALVKRGIAPDLLVRSPEIQTFTYSKYINLKTGIEDVPRIDLINTKPVPESAEKELVNRLRDYGPRFDVIIVADQAETTAGGAVTPKLRETIQELGRNRVVWVDSRKRIEQFRHVTLKPNEDEANEACGRIGAPGNYARLLEVTQAPWLIVTHGGEGAVVLDKDGKEHHVPGKRIPNPVDICGAGDSFSAGGAVTLAVTGDAVQAAMFGNLVASITVMQPGTGTASPEQVRAAAARE